MTVIITLFLITSCALTLDGKARSWKKGEKEFTKLCKDHGGLNYHLGQSKGVCNNGKIFE